MKTVFPKRRVLVYLALFGSAVLFLIALQFSGDSEDHAKPDIVNSRDIIQRRVVEERKEAQVDVKEVPVQNEDFVDDKEEKKESLEVADELIKKDEKGSKLPEENEALKEVIEPPDNDDGTV